MEPQMTDTTDQLPSYTPGHSADWSLIPDYMIGGLRRYIEYGVPPGSFLTALLSNDLRATFERADDENRRCVENYVRFLYSYAPSQCWGSPARFDAWCKKGGLSVHAA
jgi:hypothetical protein